MHCWYLATSFIIVTLTIFLISTHNDLDIRHTILTLKHHFDIDIHCDLDLQSPTHHPIHFARQLIFLHLPQYLWCECLVSTLSIPSSHILPILGYHSVFGHDIYIFYFPSLGLILITLEKVKATKVCEHLKINIQHAKCFVEINLNCPALSTIKFSHI
jgi:hypothetical protein